ncbi:MAG: hypothetical protein ACE5QW_09005 [Thermoplasmata archaeon]
MRSKLLCVWQQYVDLTSGNWDGDGISHGQEYNGYDVPIELMKGDETKSNDKKVYGDPMQAYIDENGQPLDVDEDGIPDFIEVDPINIAEEQNYTIAEYMKTHNETSIEKRFNPPLERTTPFLPRWNGSKA